MADLISDIEHFFGYFRAQHRFLCDLPTLIDRAKMLEAYGVQPVDNLRLLNTCAHIEALGRVVAPVPERSQAVFTAALIDWSGRPEWKLVSLVELWRALADPERVRAEALRARLQRAQASLQSLPGYPFQVAPSSVVGMSRIVSAVEVDADIPAARMALQNAGVTLDKDWEVLLQNFTLAGILYRDYRCGLAHEARRLAEGWNFADSKVPHYHSQMKFLEGTDDHDTEACLVVPDAFVLASLAGCIDRIEEHCRDQHINPYDRVE